MPDHNKPLGKGSYGEIHRVIHLVTAKEYACKVIVKQSIFANRMEAEVRREVDILGHLLRQRHPHIIALKEVIEDAKRVYIVMELCTGGELYDHIIEHSDHYSEADAAALMATILDVVADCHSAGVVHRNLRPESFLLSHRGQGAQLKVINFELAQFLAPRQQLYDHVGNAYYVAPEMLKAKQGKEGYGKEVDVWSCGVILCILLSGLPPFGGSHEADIRRAVLTQDLDEVLARHPWDQISDAAKAVVRRMLERDPKKRARVHELKEDNWILSAAPKEGLLRVVENMKSFATANKLRRAAILMLARELPPSEEEGLHGMFKQMDTDKDGFITVDELRRAVGDVLPERELHEIMMLADANESGDIDWQEFIGAVMNHSKVLRGQQLVKVFEQLDENHDGSLDKQELIKAFQMLNIKGGVNDVMRQADKDRDGRISFQEFCDLVTQGG